MKIADIIALIGLIGFGICLVLMVWGCTYNISMAHTSGQASDVIDDTQTPQNTVSPNVELPLLGK